MNVTVLSLFASYTFHPAPLYRNTVGEASAGFNAIPYVNVKYTHQYTSGLFHWFEETAPEANLEHMLAQHWSTGAVH